MLLSVLDSADAATDAGFALIVLSQILGIGQHSLEELQRNNLHHLFAAAVGLGSLVFHLVNAAHANVLNHIQIVQILLAEGHPEAGTLDGGEVDDKALNLLVMQEIALAGTDIGIVQGLVNLHRFGLDVLTVLIVKSLLGDFTNVDFGIEVGGECLVMVSGIAVHDVQIVDFIEVVLCGISGKHAGHTGVETASQNGAKASLLEAFTVGPLPAVFEMSLILGLIVGGIQIVATGLQTGFHDGEVLIRQGQVHHNVGLVGAKQLHKLFHAVRIHLCRLHVCSVLLVQHISQCVALLFGAAGNHDFGKHFRILAHLMCRNRSHASGSDNQYFSHIFLFLFCYIFLCQTVSIKFLGTYAHGMHQAEAGEHMVHSVCRMGLHGQERHLKLAVGCELFVQQVAIASHIGHQHHTPLLLVLHKCLHTLHKEGFAGIDVFFCYGTEQKLAQLVIAESLSVHFLLQICRQEVGQFPACCRMYKNHLHLALLRFPTGIKGTAHKPRSHVGSRNFPAQHALEITAQVGGHGIRMVGINQNDSVL